MRVVGLPKVFYQLARHRPLELSPQAHDRLRWVLAWQALREQGLSSTEASERLGLSRPTLYRWLGRLQQQGAVGLEMRSRKPRRRRLPTWSPSLAEAVLRVREQYPRWGKDKLVVLLRREGWYVSTSMVGRILSRLKARGILREPPRSGTTVRRRPRRRPYGVRKPKAYQAHAPGDLVEVDTVEVRPIPGVILKQFTACDVVSRWDVLGVHRQATASLAAQFLETLLERMPFPVQAVQVDGGSEFFAEFEQAAQERGLRLFVLPPHSPKLNGHVERAHRTHQEEFYEVTPSAWTLAELRPELRAWEDIYNTVRPHQALGYLTPAEFLAQQRRLSGALPLARSALSPPTSAVKARSPQGGAGGAGLDALVHSAGRAGVAPHPSGRRAAQPLSSALPPSAGPPLSHMW